MPVISVSLPGEDLETFDRLVDHMGYESRSSAVRDALYHFVQAHRLGLEDGEEGEVGLALTLVYAADRGQSEVQSLVHDEEEIVRTVLHQHLDDRCVDLLVLQGPGARVHELLDQLTAIRDVRVNVSPL